MNQSALELRPVTVEIVNGQPTTTSLDVAEHFDKRHDTVLRAIRQLDCSPEFRRRNFAETFQDTQVPNGATRKDPAFRMTRDGFTFLCMGFTGAQAARWKEAYIEAFNRLEREQRNGRPENPLKPGTRWLMSLNAAGDIEMQELPADALVARGEMIRTVFEAASLARAAQVAIMDAMGPAFLLRMDSLKAANDRAGKWLARETVKI